MDFTQYLGENATIKSIPYPIRLFVSDFVRKEINQVKKECIAEIDELEDTMQQLANCYSLLKAEGKSDLEILELFYKLSN